MTSPVTPSYLANALSVDDPGPATLPLPAITALIICLPEKSTAAPAGLRTRLPEAVATVGVVTEVVAANVETPDTAPKSLTIIGESLIAFPVVFEYRGTAFRVADDGPTTSPIPAITALVMFLPLKSTSVPAGLRLRLPDDVTMDAVLIGLEKATLEPAELVMVGVSMLRMLLMFLLLNAIVVPDVVIIGVLTDVPAVIVAPDTPPEVEIFSLPKLTDVPAEFVMVWTSKLEVEKLPVEIAVAVSDATPVTFLLLKSIAVPEVVIVGTDRVLVMVAAVVTKFAIFVRVFWLKLIVAPAEFVMDGTSRTRAVNRDTPEMFFELNWISDPWVLVMEGVSTLPATTSPDVVMFSEPNDTLVPLLLIMVPTSKVPVAVMLPTLRALAVILPAVVKFSKPNEIPVPALLTMTLVSIVSADKRLMLKMSF